MPKTCRLCLWRTPNHRCQTQGTGPDPTCAQCSCGPLKKTKCIYLMFLAQWICSFHTGYKTRTKVDIFLNFFFPKHYKYLVFFPSPNRPEHKLSNIFLYMNSDFKLQFLTKKLENEFHTLALNCPLCCSVSWDRP